MEFPNIENWRKILVPGDEKFGRQDFYDYYKTKYEIAKRFSPKSIGEIGVRWGYSAIAFLCANPSAAYSGFDMINGGHGGVKGQTFEHVYKMLKEYFPDSSVTLTYCDTRTVDKLDGSFDFFHIDGNHSESGAYHDIQIVFAAMQPGGIILIDDYTYIDGVKQAAESFVYNHRDLIEKYEFIQSLRGEFIIQKKV